MRIGLIILIFLAHTSLGQFNYVFDQSVPVTLENGGALSMPWAGGLNATHFNTIDLNNDGLEDLAIFDRTANRVITFVQNDSQYQYAPEFEILFPSDILNWMLLRDYNGDGKKDIFTGNNLGIKVYTNITPAGEALMFQHFLFSVGVGSKSPVILTTGFSGKINLQLNSADLPSINDADGDGDLDIFVPRYPNGSTIEFHKNLSVENGESLDSLDYARTPQTPQAWGGVTECDCGEFAFNNEPCDAGGRTLHIGGKSLFAFDADNDGDQDILFSEEGHANEGGCQQLFLLENEGSNAIPVVNSAANYPSGSSSFMSYPAAFYEDVDFDGVKDLILSTNIRARQLLQTNLKQSVKFYKNTGTTQQPTFALPNPDFLQENMIDVGDNAVPAFFDADGDGDFDLFVGCYTRNFSGSIYYFENTGTQSIPAFKLITQDFLGLSFLNLFNIKPAFADMNSDGKIDLAFSGTSLFGAGTQLYYLPNSNAFGANFSQPTVATGFFISSADNISILDVNLDGKKDLLVGKADGHLEYWKNTSAGSTLTYNLENDSYLGIGPSVLRRGLSCTAADLNNDYQTDLLIGNNNGILSVIDNFREVEDATSSISNIIYNPQQDAYVSQNLGGAIWHTVANLFRTDKPSIIVGNLLGGLHILRPNEEVQLEKPPLIEIYPNPIVKGSSILNIKVDQPAALILLSALGQEIGTPVYFQAFENNSFQLQELPKGVYFLYFIIKGKSLTRRIVVY
jgi:hypothetical protein